MPARSRPAAAPAAAPVGNRINNDHYNESEGLYVALKRLFTRKSPPDLGPSLSRPTTVLSPSHAAAGKTAPSPRSRRAPLPRFRKRQSRVTAGPTGVPLPRRAAYVPRHAARDALMSVPLRYRIADFDTLAMIKERRRHSEDLHALHCEIGFCSVPAARTSAWLSVDAASPQSGASAHSPTCSFDAMTSPPRGMGLGRTRSADAKPTSYGHLPSIRSHPCLARIEEHPADYWMGLQQGESSSSASARSEALEEMDHLAVLKELEALKEPKEGAEVDPPTEVLKHLSLDGPVEALKRFEDRSAAGAHRTAEGKLLDLPPSLFPSSAPLGHSHQHPEHRQLDHFSSPAPHLRKPRPAHRRPRYFSHGVLPDLRNTNNDRPDSASTGEQRRVPHPSSQMAESSEHTTSTTIASSSSPHGAESSTRSWAGSLSQAAEDGDASASTALTVPSSEGAGSVSWERDGK